MGDGISNMPEPSGSLLSPGILDAAAEQTPYRMSMPAMGRGMDNLQGMLFPMSCQVVQLNAIGGLLHCTEVILFAKASMTSSC